MRRHVWTVPPETWIHYAPESYVVAPCIGCGERDRRGGVHGWRWRRLRQPQRVGVGGWRSIRVEAICPDCFVKRESA